MSRGDLLVGSFANNQVGTIVLSLVRVVIAHRFRPLFVRRLNAPRGQYHGLCGYNAARVIAADLGKGIWWNPP